MAQNDDPPRTSREERRRRQSADAGTEDGDVVVLRHRLLLHAEDGLRNALHATAPAPLPRRPGDDLDAPIGQPLEDRRQKHVLFFEDSRRERGRIVAVEHRHRRLRDDRARVGPGVDEVHGAARHFDAVKKAPSARWCPETRGAATGALHHPHRESVENVRVTIRMNPASTT